MHDFVEYVCPSCGESIQVAIDVAAGERQQYVEDCPVCCRPNVLRIEVDEDGHAFVQADSES